MTRPPLQFCSVLSAEVGEPLPGTGVHQPANVLIRWPKARWRYSLRLADGMPPALLDAIEANVAAGRRVNLIDRKGEPDTHARVMLTPEELACDVAIDTLPDLLEAILSKSDLAPFNPRPMPARVLLCCTHGKHDRCCAKFGFATYKALAAEAGQHAADFDIWEATHLGGCRLAASVLSLPSRRKYGRVAPNAARAFLDAEAADEPFLPSYRGAADLSPPAQAAEVTARMSGHGPIRRVTERSATKDRHIFEIQTDTGSVAIAVDGKAMATYDACGDIDDPQEEPGRKTVWTGRIL